MQFLRSTAISPVTFFVLVNTYVVTVSDVNAQQSKMTGTVFDFPEKAENFSEAQKTVVRLWRFLADSAKQKKISKHMHAVHAVDLAEQFRDQVGEDKPFEYVLAHLWIAHFLMEEGNELHRAESELRTAKSVVNKMTGDQGHDLGILTDWLDGKLRVLRGQRAPISLREISFDEKNLPHLRQIGWIPVELDLVHLPSLVYLEAMYQLKKAVYALEGTPLTDHPSQKRARELFERAISAFETHPDAESSLAMTLSKMDDGAHGFYGDFGLALPVTKRDINDVAGRLYFHHALTCVLEWDIPAAEKSMKRLRELVPDWKVSTDVKPLNYSRSEAREELAQYDHLGEDITWYEVNDAYTSHEFSYRALVYRDLGMTPEMVLDHVASYLSCESMFKKGYEDQAKRQKTEQLLSICRNLEYGPLVLAFATCEYRDFQPLALQALRGEALCGNPERVLSSFANYLNTFHKTRVPYAPQWDKANVLQGKGNLEWTLNKTGGVISNSSYLEHFLDLLVSDRSLTPGSYHNEVQFHNHYFVRTKKWTSEELRVLRKYSFPEYVTVFQTPLRERSSQKGELRIQGDAILIDLNK